MVRNIKWFPVHLLAVAILVGGCSSAVTGTTSVSSSVSSTAVSTTASATTSSTTTTGTTVDLTNERMNYLTSGGTLPEGKLFEMDLPLPEGIDYAQTCSISEGTIFSDDLSEYNYDVMIVNEGNTASCDYVFFFYDRRLTDEEMESYIDILDSTGYINGPMYNGSEHYGTTYDGIYMCVHNYYPSNTYPDGRAIIIFATSDENEDWFFSAG